MASVSTPLRSMAPPSLPPGSAVHSKRSSNSGTPSLIDRLMRDAADGVDVSARLPELKRAILLDGLDADEAGMSTHRVYIWLLLLRAPLLPYPAYAALLSRGGSPAAAKINDDTFRTLATDPLFTRRVSQNSLSRLLNAVAWTLHDAHERAAAAVPLPPSPTTTAATMSPPQALSPPPTGGRDGGHSLRELEQAPFGTPGTPATPPALPPPSTARPPSTGGDVYLQGMNVLAAPLLYSARSEAQAHALLTTLLTVHLPAYVRPAMPGVHRGCRLLTPLLARLDPALHAHLDAHGLAAQPAVYAFPAVLTLSACTPPLPEALALWDFLLAWGVHLNLLAVVAQLVLMREKILGSASPARELRSLGPLRARRVVELVVSFVPRIEGELWEEVVRHTEV